MAANDIAQMSYDLTNMYTHCDSRATAHMEPSSQGAEKTALLQHPACCGKHGGIAARQGGRSTHC